MERISYESGFEDGIIYKGALWTVAVKKPWLCKISLQDYKVEFVTRIPDVDSTSFSYKIVAQEGTKLILMPIVANCIYEYDINKNSFEKIKLNQAIKTSGDMGGAVFKFRAFARRDDIIWMMPQSSMCIVEYNIKKKKVVEHTHWYEKIKDALETDDEDKTLFGMGIMVADSLWMPSLHKNAIIEFSTKDASVKWHCVGDDNNRFEAIAYDNNSFWLLDNMNRSLYVWDGKKDAREVASLPEWYAIDEQFARANNQSSCLAVYYIQALAGKLLLQPLCANSFVLFDTNIKQFKQLSMKTSGVAYCSNINILEDRILCVSQTRNEAVVFSHEFKELSRTSLCVDVKMEDFSTSNTFLENEIRLQTFLNNIERVKTTREGSNLSNGIKIYKKVIE